MSFDGLKMSKTPMNPDVTKIQASREWVHPDNQKVYHSCCQCSAMPMCVIQAKYAATGTFYCEECLLKAAGQYGFGKRFLNDKVLLRCPVEKCDRRLSLQEFLEHSEAKCISYKISQHEHEIERLDKERIAALGKSLSEAKMTKEKEKAEIEKLEKNQVELEKKILSLDETLKSLMTKSDKKMKTDDLCCVCLESYDTNNHVRACIASCFHSFCFSCLNDLDPKFCPKCRNPFKSDQIKKIY